VLKIYQGLALHFHGIEICRLGNELLRLERNNGGQCEHDNQGNAARRSSGFIVSLISGFAVIDSTPDRFPAAISSGRYFGLLRGKYQQALYLQGLPRTPI